MELVKQMNEVNAGLLRAQMEVNSLTEKVIRLEAICVDANLREKHSRELVMELLERQKELNVMLNRANMMLNRAQDVILTLSADFTELAEAHPTHKKREWDQRLTRINELFRQTGVPDAKPDRVEEQPAIAENGFDHSPQPKEPIEGTFADIAEPEEQPQEVVEETPEEAPQLEPGVAAASTTCVESLLFPPRKKSWRQ